jgi:hypothetical protein
VEEDGLGREEDDDDDDDDVAKRDDRILGRGVEEDELGFMAFFLPFFVLDCLFFGFCGRCGRAFFVCVCG